MRQFEVETRDVGDLEAKTYTLHERLEVASIPKNQYWFISSITSKCWDREEPVTMQLTFKPDDDSQGETVIAVVEASQRLKIQGGNAGDERIGRKIIFDCDGKLFLRATGARYANARVLFHAILRRGQLDPARPFSNFIESMILNGQNK